jgi:DNA-binding YbaB/EbfC family protein
MIDGLKNMAGLASLMKDLPKIKAKMAQIKEQLGDLVVEAETGGGAVRVKANGLMRVVSIEVDQAMMSGLVDSSDPDDRVMAQDLIVGAVNAALTKARESAEQEMANAAGEMGLPLPPGGLGGLMG